MRKASSTRHFVVLTSSIDGAYVMSSSCLKRASRIGQCLLLLPPASKHVWFACSQVPPQVPRHVRSPTESKRPSCRFRESLLPLRLIPCGRCGGSFRPPRDEVANSLHGARDFVELTDTRAPTIPARQCGQVGAATRQWRYSGRHLSFRHQSWVNQSFALASSASGWR